MNEVITKKNSELNKVEKEALEMLNNPQRNYSAPVP